MKQQQNAPVSANGRAWVEIDRQALRENAKTLLALCPKGCRLMPAVKANAYGHGAVGVARELNQIGVNAFCVACVSEGVELRKGRIKGDILILGYTHPDDFTLLHRYRLTQTVIDAAYAKQLNRYGKKLAVHIGIDTGMRRLGEKSENTDAILSVFRMKNLIVNGIYSHLCDDDSLTEESRAFTEKQAAAFEQTVAEIQKQGIPRPKTHLLSSYGAIHYPQYGGDYLRAGIALYGILSKKADADECPAPLIPTLSLKTRVASVREILAGESAGYNRAFTAKQNRKIASLAIGYADGVPRALSCGVGSVLIHGKKAPIVGQICMDQTIVDVTEIPEINPGDTAILIGRSGDAEITACDIAAQCGTIANEILSRLGNRLTRIIT